MEVLLHVLLVAIVGLVAGVAGIAIGLIIDSYRRTRVRAPRVDLSAYSLPPRPGARPATPGVIELDARRAIRATSSDA